jgi:hypothetical protein
MLLAWHRRIVKTRAGLSASIGCCGPSPITSSRMGHLRGALSRGHDELGSATRQNILPGIDP